MRINLTGVTATGFHGVLPHERRDGQPFTVDVFLDLAGEPSTDDLSGTVNYAEVADTVVEHIEGEAFQLIETLAIRIADDLITLEPVRGVEVVVHKPQAPIPVPFSDVSVSLTRSKP